MSVSSSASRVRNLGLYRVWFRSVDDRLRHRAAGDEYVAPIVVAGDLRLEAYLAQQPYPFRTREEPADMPVVLYPRRLTVFPQQVGVLHRVGRVGVVRIVGPFQIPQRASLTVAATVVGARLKSLPD